MVKSSLRNNNNNNSITAMQKNRNPVVVVIVALTLVVMFYLERSLHYKFLLQQSQQQQQQSLQTTFLGQSSSSIPVGKKAKALPSIQSLKDATNSNNRKVGVTYGGKGDKLHLGGFTAYDKEGVSPGTWKWMMEWMGVKSIVDLGCGKGVSTVWFQLHGAKVLCVEGSHDAVQHTLLSEPETSVVEHDFSRGPYWPDETYDALWSVEFLEHVGRNYQHNYIQVMRKAAYLFVSHSLWGGWHHVEVHQPDWWIARLESFGFRHSPYLTNLVREEARSERNKVVIGPDGNKYEGMHILRSMLVFINPSVASLPQHAHLLAEKGCFSHRNEQDIIETMDCGSRKEESTLPPDFQPLKLTPEQDQAWLELVQQHIKQQQTASNANANNE